MRDRVGAVNLEGCMLIYGAFFLIFATVCLVWFGVDVWHHLHSAKAEDSALDYGHLQSAGVCAIASGLSFGYALFINWRMKRHR